MFNAELMLNHLLSEMVYIFHFVAKYIHFAYNQASIYVAVKHRIKYM